jgi:predicted HicB family RNase H-like nuclease
MRTMIVLDKAVHTRLRHMAVDEGTSLTELIRQAVEEFLKKRGKSGGGDRR